MKPSKEILVALVDELTKHLEVIKAFKSKPLYYNEILGDTSFLLAGLLGSLLKKKYTEWNRKKWIDDSLITNVLVQKNKLVIEGVIIWGIENTTEQWTDPFLFEVELSKGKIVLKRFIFLFCDLVEPEISYEKFKVTRDYWQKKSERNWKYEINSDESLI